MKVLLRISPISSELRRTFIHFTTFGKRKNFFMRFILLKTFLKRMFIQVENNFPLFRVFLPSFLFCSLFFGSNYKMRFKSESLLGSRYPAKGSTR